MPKTLFTSPGEHLPTLTISDNRELGIRTLAYNRTNANDAADELISRNRYNTLGQLIASRDARLDIDNFRYQHNLGGAMLRTEGVDNGRSVQLADIEGRPVVSLDAKGTRTWLTYEPQMGRPLEHYQQTKHGLKTITDRFLYGKSSNEHKTSNLNGQCIRHYDTAGLQELVSLSITGVALQQQRQLLTDTLGPVDWFGEEQSWRSRLSQPFVTRCTTGALGQPIIQTDAKGHTQRMAYNRAGQLIGSWLTLRRGHEQIIVQSLTYSAAGQKLREESGNGVVTEYRYEAETQRLIGIKTTRPERVQGPKVLQDLRYDYDPVGNILAIHNDAEATRFYRNQKVVPETTYRYDALYQLIEATGRESDSNGAQSASLPALSSLTDGNQYVNYTRRYTYDRAGNLLKIKHSGASQYSTNITVSDISNHGIQQQDGLNPTDIRRQFDAAGNQQQLQPGQPLQWNERNQLQQVTTVKRQKGDSPNNDSESYLYASDGMRIVKHSIQHTNKNRQISRVIYLPGLELRTQYSGAELTEDFQVITVGAAGRAQVRILHWEHGKPDEIDNNQLRYSFDNQIGSSLLELDNNGDIISQEEYYPFGGTAVFAARNTTEGKYKILRYSGKERDATGLYYYGFRYYLPWLGRWLSADPAGTIDGLNLYRMVRNNPVGLMDEDGRMPTRKRSGEYNLLEGMDEYRSVRTSDVKGLGLHTTEYHALRSLAKDKGWDINVRTGNQARVQYVGLKGYRPKPAGVYQKTNKEGDYQGLVLYKESEYQKGLKDVENINNPSSHAMDSIKILSQEGFQLQKSIIGENTYYLLVDKFNNKVYGDIDLHSVLDKNKVAVSPDEWAPALNTALEKTKLHEKELLHGESLLVKTYNVFSHSPIQHGAHDEWQDRNDKSYAGGVNMGPQPGVLNISGKRRNSQLMINTFQYHSYLSQNSIEGDRVYTASAWKAGANRKKSDVYKPISSFE